MHLTLSEIIGCLVGFMTLITGSAAFAYRVGQNKASSVGSEISKLSFPLNGAYRKADHCENIVKGINQRFCTVDKRLEVMETRQSTIGDDVQYIRGRIDTYFD